MLPLSEAESIGSALYTVHAEDRDSGANGRVRYQLTQNTQQVFQINPTTGELSLQVSVWTLLPENLVYRWVWRLSEEGL